ncbi:MAG: hypothetical protein QM662_06910 [Gordonia sp. (in: high G+C Gram-positive bacteria)]
MSDSLQPLLDTNRQAAVDDLVAVIDAEVKGKKGVSGTVVKGAYAAAQKVKPGIVRKATNQLLPQFVAALTPFWDSKPAGTPFGDHLAANADAASEALLKVTDNEVESAKAPLVKAYNSLRGKAKEHVTDALPAVGAAIEKNV